MNVKKFFSIFVLALVALAFVVSPVMAEKPIKIGILQGSAGPMRSTEKRKSPDSRWDWNISLRGPTRLPEDPWN